MKVGAISVNKGDDFVIYWQSPIEFCENTFLRSCTKVYMQISIANYDFFKDLLVLQEIRMYINIFVIFIVSLNFTNHLNNLYYSFQIR